MISIITVSNGNLEQLQLNINSILETCENHFDELIVLCSEDDTCIPWLSNIPEIKTIVSDTKKHFVSALNFCIENTNSNNDVLILDVKTILLPNSLSMLIHSMNTHTELGAICSDSSNKGNSEEILALAKERNVPCDNNLKYRAWIPYGATLYKRKAIYKVNGFNEVFNPQGYEDIDFSLRILQAGYKSAICCNSIIYTYNNNYQYINYIPTRRDNISTFKKIWNFDVNYYSTARTDLLSLINKSSSDSFTILEIGCGLGTTLLEAHYLFPKAQLHGIEIVDSVSKLGACITDIITGNIENMTLPYNYNSIDFVLFGDVLEHLHNPHEVLNKLKPYLKNKAYILASIPNILNANIIYELLHGNFTYKDSGILDSTHLKFFTKNEIRNMFEKCGYNIEEAHSIVLPNQSTTAHKDFFNKLFLIDGISPKDEFDTFQYLVRAKLLPDKSSTYMSNMSEQQEIFYFIDKLISMHNDVSLTSIKKIILDDEIKLKCQKMPEYYFIFFALDIYSSEKRTYLESFFHDISCIQDLINKITFYKHLIFNIDFDVDTETALSIIQKNFECGNISKNALTHMITEISFKKEITLAKINDQIFKEITINE